MPFLQFTGVSLSFGDRDIIKNAAMFLRKGTRAALCGANGSGKSTFIKILAGIIQPDSGERALEKDCRISYLPQSGITHKNRTLRGEAEEAFNGIKAIEKKAEELRVMLENFKEDSQKTKSLLEEQHRLNEIVENSGYAMREKNIAVVLEGLGFSKSDLDRRSDEFSGGWQMRIALAKVLLEKPDILLLDEPTNYLDIESRSYLEKWLCSFSGAYLLVSHDRHFLDKTINEVYELFQGKLKHYAGNYSKYEALRQMEMENLAARYKEQQEEIEKTELLIRRFRYKATKAAMVQERIKKLEKIERIEIPESLKKIAITLPVPPHAGRIALSMENISKSYANMEVLKNLSITVESGERLLVVGLNGAGKSTLLRIIAGQDSDYEGKLVLGTGIKPAYFTQDAAESVFGQESVIEFLEKTSPIEMIPKLRDIAGAFLFRGDDVYKSLNVLSGGEKSRLALLKMLLKPVNLLILDEPTNHLDINSKDILQDALQKYTGTLIFVSHDYSFMEAVSTKTLELRAKNTSRLFYGNYSYYLEKISCETGDNLKNTDKTEQNTQKESSKQDAEPAIAQSAKEKREQDKKRLSLKRKLENQEADIIGQIEKLENEKKTVEADLSLPEVYTSGEKSRQCKEKLAALSEEVHKKNLEWEKIAEELAAV
ncbi:MAG: ABC-F family ATP-binding cassette domain-containing protein [Spirochaetaceae bacterium]|jgi:ATP-binding cassette subfamily F protein 3|nr:ABC-F family ATP-binding cassette domain-containing protein [Spirochaetaceae bacterium]